MHHLADNMTKVCQGGNHNGAGGESILLHYSSGEEVELIAICKIGICLYSRG